MTDGFLYRKLQYTTGPFDSEGRKGGLKLKVKEGLIGIGRIVK